MKIKITYWIYKKLMEKAWHYPWQEEQELTKLEEPLELLIF